MKSHEPVAPKGRPRSFDIDHALDQAMRVFWKKGFEGASLPELTKAMGINRPSLYAAFGSKAALFRKAIDRYARGPAAHLQGALSEPTARAVAERYLIGAVELVCNPQNPHGCLMVQGALACGDTAQRVRDELARRRTAAEAAVRQRLERAHSEGDLPADASPGDLARYLATVTQGIAVQAAGGASREELLRVATIVLQCWPT